MFICEILNAIYELCPWFFDMGDIVYKWIWRICLGRELLDETSIGNKINNRMDKSLNKHKRKHTKFMKFIGFIFLSMIIGPFYVAWIMVKWAFILPWKLFKFMFRIGRQNFQRSYFCAKNTLPFMKEIYI